MADWREYLRLARTRLGQVPAVAWVVAGLIAVSLAVVFALQLSGPPYVALYDGLSPADGGKVIAALQKLGIPYQLQAAGNVILVPEPDLAAARLQLGAEQIPQGGADAGWEKLEDAPMTASELAQDTMAVQALEASLAASIETMSGVAAAQVFLALPPDTPFLADQPKPSASVVITANETAAAAQGGAIANLVAGAVPGLTAAQVTVETTDGVAVYPAADKNGAASQMATVTQVENGAAARIALLLAPLVGQGNFRTDVSANLDFTQEQIHQVAYGPTQLVTHAVSAESMHTGNDPAAIGIPGALSNEPPGATTAATPAAPPTPAAGGPAGAAGAAGAAGTPSASSTAGANATVPGQTTKNLDQTYVTDQSDSDITKPDWVVKSVAVSVVLNKAALGTVTIEQVKAAIAGAFAYPQVSVNVLAAAFQPPGVPYASHGMMFEDYDALTRAGLDLLAAAALLFGLALPLGRRMAGVTFAPEVAPPVQRVAQVSLLPPPDFAHLRERASENITSVARLLQSWVEDDG
jgi:flagellar M-ring protein FliF